MSEREVGEPGDVRSAWPLSHVGPVSHRPPFGVIHVSGPHGTIDGIHPIDHCHVDMMGLGWGPERPNGRRTLGGSMEYKLRKG